jgi:hypothetical protein
VAIPTFVAAGTFATGTGSVTPGLPAGWAQDDIFILVVQSEGGASISPPGAFTLIDSASTGTGAGSCKEAVFYLRASASESAPTVSDTGDHTLAVILAFRGCITTGNPIATFTAAIATSTTSLSFGSITTTVADCLIVLAGTHGLDTTGGQVSGYTNASLTSLAELFDDSATDGFGGGIFVAAGGKPAAGSTGTTSATLASSGNAVLYSLALTPVPAPRAYPNSMPSISHFIGR